MNKIRLLCDTTITPSYEDYIEWCEMNEKKPQEEDSEDYFDYVHKIQRLEYDDLIENLQYSVVDTQYYWVVTGSLGLWCGRRDVGKNLVGSLSDAIKLCTSHAADCIITKRGSVIYVTALHHDGRNYLEIRALSDKGIDRFERNGDVSINNRQNIATLPKYLF